jgi:hypothetical protein
VIDINQLTTGIFGPNACVVVVIKFGNAKAATGRGVRRMAFCAMQPPL